MDWDALYAHLITATGWTWSQIDTEMTMARAAALARYWEHWPPVHVGVARILQALGAEMRPRTPSLGDLPHASPTPSRGGFDAPPDPSALVGFTEVAAPFPKPMTAEEYLRRKYEAHDGKPH